MEPQPPPSTLTIVEKISLLLGGIFISLLAFVFSWFLQIFGKEILEMEPRMEGLLRASTYFVSFFILVVLYLVFRKRKPYLA